MKFQLDGVLDEYHLLEKELEDPSIYGDPARLRVIMQQKKSLEAVVEAYLAYKKTWKDVEDARELLRGEKNDEMLSLLKEEITTGEKSIIEMEDQIKFLLIPKDKNDDKNIILEIRAGTGGDEAALFAGELSVAYMNFAKKLGFGIEILDASPTENKGMKEIIIKVTGFGAYAKLKYEGGTHRVQRIPETESKGRVHTSAATVAVLPEVDEVDVQIKDEDLEITACRSSGAGGQHVNKTESAIRVVHKPTGIVVECQDGRSQIKNKEKALGILRSRVYALEEAKRHEAIASNRLAQVGSGDRSEKIRTYNYPQDRITDHRIGQNFSNIPIVMMGELDDIVDALAIAEQTEKLEQASGINRDE